MDHESLSQHLFGRSRSIHGLLLKESVRLCRQYYSDFHGIDDFSKISVNYLATGGMGMVSLF